MASTVLPPGYCEHDGGILPLVLSWTLFSIATVVIALRVLIRIRNGQTGWDDYTIVIALLVAAAGFACYTKAVQHGFGKHNLCSTVAQNMAIYKWSTYAEIIDTIGIMLIKVSICFGVLRIIQKTRKKTHYFLWGLMVVVIAIHIAQAVLFGAQCIPLRAVWDLSVKGKCLSKESIYRSLYSETALDILTDLVCAGIPILVIRQLQMNKQTKLLLCILMGLGVLVTGSAIAKLATLNVVFSLDESWAAAVSITCSSLEANFGLIIASLPALRPLFGNVDGSKLSLSYLRPRAFQRLHGDKKEGSSESTDLNSASSQQQIIPPVGENTVRKTTEFSVHSETKIPDLEMKMGCYDVFPRS